MKPNKRRKITPEHYEHLRDLIVPLDTRERRQAYVDGRFPGAARTTHPAHRYRWDLLYAAGVPAGSWVRDTLYPYLDDSQIDSALRRILGMGYGARMTAKDVLHARAPQAPAAALDTAERERLDYLSRVRANYARRTVESHGEHSPCGPMGTAERMACSDALLFEQRHGAELNQLLLRHMQALGVQS